MSWHGRNGGKDPSAKLAKAGDALGCWRVVRHVEPDAHAGLRVLVRCTHCKAEQVRVLTQLRYEQKRGGLTTHRGCTAKTKEAQP
jgi:hypothetical protein